MALSGKVARSRLIGAAAVTFILCTSAFAAPLLPDNAQWRDPLPTIPSAFASLFSPNYNQASPPAGLTVVQQDWQGFVLGELVGNVKTSVYKTQDDELIFDYVIQRDNAGTGAISFVSLDGPGWQGLDILDVGVGPIGSSGHGDATPEWADGTPAFIARDGQTGTPFWRYRTAVLNVPLLGTLIGQGDTSAHIWFKTNAVTFAEGSMVLGTDSGISGRASVLVPMVPEPATLTLLSAVSLLFIRRRNRR